MKDGFVALLDVLGFSNLVLDSGEEGIQRYLACLQNATGHTEVNFVVFSDSIVLSAKGDSPDSFIAVAGACSRLLNDLLRVGIALRGAISYGSFIREAFGESVFVAGRAVIDAYQFEQAQDWVGIMVSPSALARVKDLETRCYLDGNLHSLGGHLIDLLARIGWAGLIQPYRSIPFHSPNPLDPQTFDGFAVVPTTRELTPAALHDCVGVARDRLKWLRAVAPSPSAQRKFQQTDLWLNYIQASWLQIKRSLEQTNS